MATESKITITSKEREAALVKCGKEARKNYPVVEQGTIIATDGLVIFFRYQDKLLRISTKACVRCPRMNFSIDLDTGIIYGKTSVEAAYVAYLVKGILFSALYPDGIVQKTSHKEEKLKEEHRDKKKPRRSKNSSAPSSWIPAPQSPHTGTKKFGRPKKQVAVKGYVRKLKNGKEIFVRPYSRYLENVECENTKEYLV